MPCKDTGIEYNNENSSVLQQKDCDQERTLNDVCSPFCVCSCCTTPTVAIEQLYKINLPLIVASLYGEHQQGEFIDISLPVWQPPQLA